MHNVVLEQKIASIKMPWRNTEYSEKILPIDTSKYTSLDKCFRRFKSGREDSIEKRKPIETIN